MTLVAVPATAGLWIDFDFVMTPARIQAVLAWSLPSDIGRLKAGAKVAGGFGYSALPGEHPDGTLWTPQSLTDWTDAGLQAGWIQHPLNPGWLGSEHLGALHEAQASEYAAEVGFPVGMHGGLDVEGCGGSSYGYALTWASNRVQRGGKCLGYHGFELGMGLWEFADMPNVTSYWRAQNQQPLPGPRGDAIIQHYPSVTIPGVGRVDLNDLAPDLRWQVPIVAARVLETA